MRILFIGCVESSMYALNLLLEQGKDVCGVVTKKRSTFNADFVDISVLCKKSNTPYVYFSDKSYSQYVEFVASCAPDIVYCIGWPHLIKEDVLSIPPLGVIGFHPAALPKNRGRHPLIWALALGLKETASTFFFIEKGTDNGDIISQEPIIIADEDNAATLYAKVMDVAGRQLLSLTHDLEHGLVVRTPQDEGCATYWRKRSKADGTIDFRMSAKTIYNLVRALTKPYVGAHFLYDNKEYRVWDARVILDEEGIYANVEFGKVINVFSNTSFLVKTGNGLLHIVDCDEITLTKGGYL